MKLGIIYFLCKIIEKMLQICKTKYSSKIVIKKLFQRVKKRNTAFLLLKTGLHIELL